MSSNEYYSDLEKAKKINTINEDKLYHPMSISVYPANWSGSAFEKYKKQEFNQLNESVCYNELKDSNNRKKLKFYTTNFADLLDAKKEDNFFGMTIKEGVFVPASEIDEYSNLINGKDGGILSNCKIKNSLGALPLPTTPYRGQVSHGDVRIEDNKIRPIVNPKKKACLPRDHDFEKRSFAIFDNAELIDTPNPFLSVESKDKGFQAQYGISSRFIDKFKTLDYHIDVNKINNYKYT